MKPPVRTYVKSFQFDSFLLQISSSSAEHHTRAGLTAPHMVSKTQQTYVSVRRKLESAQVIKEARVT